MNEELNIYNLWVVTEWWQWSGTSVSDTLYTSKEEAEIAAQDTREKLLTMKATDVKVAVDTLDGYMSTMRDQTRHEAYYEGRDSMSDGC